MIRLTVEAVRGLKGAPASIILVLSVNRLGVSQEYLERNTGYTDKPISQALEYLREHGHVVKTASGWKLAGTDQQLPLGFADEVKDAADPAPLQAEGPLDAPNVTSGRNNSDSGADVLVVLKDSDSNESLKTITTPETGVGKIPTRRGGAHLANVTRALLRKGLPADAADDPFPADLRAAVERLVATAHLDRKRAELAVARSPWTAPQILEQVEIWSAYQRSPYGANLDASRFPWLIAARIEEGQPCPYDTRGQAGAGGDRYDGYLEYTQPTEENDPEEG